MQFSIGRPPGDRGATAAPVTAAPPQSGGHLMSQAGITNGEDNLVMRWATAWSTQDAPSFLSLFVEDARYCDVALDKTFCGREAIKAFFEGHSRHSQTSKWK